MEALIGGGGGGGGNPLAAVAGGDGGGGATALKAPRKNLWTKAKRSGLLLGVIKQMEHDYSEYTEDPSMLAQLVELEDEVSMFWEHVEVICQREAGDASRPGINLETYRQVRNRSDARNRKTAR